MEKKMFLALVITLTCLQGSLGAAPAITGGATGTVAENSPGGTVVLALTSDQTANWVLAGNDAASFALTDASGTSSTLKTGMSAEFDFETKTSYSVTVTVTNAGSEATNHAVTVTVTNLNEAPSFQGSTSKVVPAGADSTTAIATTVATDPESQTITYSLGSPYTVTFTISTTGVITIKPGVTLNNRGAVYFIDVMASDGQTPALEDTTYVAVCVASCPTVCSGAALLTGAVAALMLTLMAQLA